MRELFNGEEAVMRTVPGEVVFDADREAAALADGRRVEVLPQPLL